MAEQEAKFSIKVDADSDAAAEAAAELEKLRSAIQKSTDAISNHSKSLRLLKGNSDEVTSARDKLKAAIAAEQALVTKNNLAILKLGGSYGKLAKAEKDARAASDANRKALSAIGGPVKDLQEKFDGLKTILEGATSGWGLLAVAVSAGVAAFAFGVAGIAGLIGKLTEFVVVSGDSLRNMGLMREAVSGNTANATAWGHQIDWLALKLATSKDELNEMVVALEKSTRGTRISGQGMVDVFQAVATASAAMGKDTGKALEDILTRGKMTGRFWVGWKAPGISELQGTGVSYQKLAEQLGQNLHIGTEAAKRALMTGRVSLDQGAKAVREVVEGRFADINAKKMLSLDALWTKFKDNVRDFSQDAAKEGGALEPILKGLKSIVDMFGLQTESGQNTKRVVTEYANAFSAFVTRNLPLAKEMVSAGLSMVGWLIHATAAVVTFAQSSTGMFLMKSVLAGIAAGLVAVAVAFAPVVVLGAAVGAVFVGIGAAIGLLVKLVRGLASMEWKSIGLGIVEGIKDGLLAGWEALKGAVVKMGTGIKDEFRSILQIHSPSKVFRGYGLQSGAGYAEGVQASQPQVSRAAGTMADSATSGAQGGGSEAAATTGGAPGSVTIQNTFHITGSGAHETAQALQSESFTALFGAAMRRSLIGAGIPVGQPSYSGGA